MPIRNERLVSCLALVLLTAATFANALPNRFVSFDDWFLVEENTRIRSLSPASVHRILTTQSHHTWLPLRELTYAFDYAIWGLLPFGYHLTNVLFHIANVLLVYALLRRLLRAPWLPLLGAAWFAVHPVQVESVAWISGRRDVQYAFFYLLALLAFMEWDKRRDATRWGFYAASLVCLGASLLSKAAAMTFPAILFLLMFLMSGPGDDLVRKIALTVPHGVLAAAATAAHTAIAHQAGIVKGPALSSSIATLPLILAKYGRLLFLPVHLATPHGDGTLAWSQAARIALLAASVVAVVVLAWWAAPRRALAVLCLGWWFVMLLPVSNLVPLSVLVAERYLYLPLVGACALGADVVGSLMAGRRRLVVGCAALTVVLLAAASMSRNRAWEDGRIFWHDGISKWPDIPVTRIGLAAEYLDMGEFEGAWAQYMMIARAGGRAASTHPDHTSLVHIGLGRCYDRLARQREAAGRPEAALEVYETVVQIMPKKVEPRVRLAKAYERHGKSEKALAQVRAIKQLDKDHEDIDEWLDRLEPPVQ